MSSKTKEAIKKEFDAFAAKVARLESLRHQFEALDVKGFEADARTIRAKLNDVHSIDQVGRDIDVLRRKISHKGAPPLESRHDHEKMMALSQYLERKTEELRGKITALEQRIAEKRKVSVKKQLSRDEVASVHDIPKLEKELASLRASLASHLKSRAVKIDAGVGLIVDTKFDDFVAGIKAELSQRLKQKELVMDAALKVDVQSQETLFAEKYAALVDEFHARYRAKVHDALRDEVKRRFEQELHARLDVEKRRVVNELIRANARRLHAEKRKLVDQMQAALAEKERTLVLSLHQSFATTSKELRARNAATRALLEKRLTLLHQKETALEAARAQTAHELAQRTSDFNTAEKRLTRTLAHKKAAFERRLHTVHAHVAAHERALHTLAVRLKQEHAALAARQSELVAQKKAHFDAMRTRFVKLLARRKARLEAHATRMETHHRRELHEKKNALRARAHVLQQQIDAYHVRSKQLLERMELERARFVTQQAAILAARKKEMRAVVERKLAQVSKKMQRLRAEEIARAHRDATQRVLVTREADALIQKKQAEFNSLQEEHQLLQRERVSLREKLKALERQGRVALLAHKKRLTRQIAVHLRTRFVKLLARRKARLEAHATRLEAQQTRELSEKKKVLRTQAVALQQQITEHQHRINRLTAHMEAERARFLKQQAAILASRKERVRASVQQKLNALSKKMQHVKAEALLHRRKHLLQRSLLKREAFALLQKKRVEFRALQEEHEALQQERASLHRKLSELQRHERAALVAHKHRLVKQLAEQQRVHTLLFEKKVSAMKTAMAQELKKRAAFLALHHDADVKREAQIREQALRTQLEHQYRERLKQTLAQQEIALQHKKELLERHVMEHLKKVLS